MHACLREHRTELTERCRAEEVKLAIMEASNTELMPSLARACKAERAAHCKAVRPGKARVFSCLLQHSDEVRLSDFHLRTLLNFGGGGTPNFLFSLVLFTNLCLCFQLVNFRTRWPGLQSVFSSFLHGCCRTQRLAGLQFGHRLKAEAAKGSCKRLSPDVCLWHRQCWAVPCWAKASRPIASAGTASLSVCHSCCSLTQHRYTYRCVSSFLPSFQGHQNESAHGEHPKSGECSGQMVVYRY